VVKLVGVCWSEGLFACCLEFVENGSLEDWLRRTVGGKKYVAAKMPVIGKKKQTDAGPSEAEVAFLGFNHNNEYNPAEHTDLDKQMLEEGKGIVAKSWNDRYNPSERWEEVLNEDGSKLDGGVTGFSKYDPITRCGYGVAHVFINAKPSQVMARFRDVRNSPVEKTRFEGNTYTAGLYFSVVPSNIPTISDREVMYRTVYFKEDEYSFSSCGYSVEDERQLPAKDRVRIDSLFCFLVKEAGGSEGDKCEVWRLNRMDPKFGKGLGFVNKIAASKATQYNAAPLVSLKRDVERLTQEYKPPKHRVEELELTWKGGLWRMALEAALGIQYLHHHRYWSDGGKRHNGATNEVEEEEAGWKVRAKRAQEEADWSALMLTYLARAGIGDPPRPEAGQHAIDEGLDAEADGLRGGEGAEHGRHDDLGGHAHLRRTRGVTREPLRREGGHVELRLVFGGDDQGGEDFRAVLLPGKSPCAQVYKRLLITFIFFQALRKHKRKKNTKGLGMGQMTK
jgi:hypothetical protein